MLGISRISRFSRFSRKPPKSKIPQKIGTVTSDFR